MKTKLSEYIKFLVSMALILSLVAPSYASLSASDGSAFVTKAEFDSALADFNSRLTTFEAGINSKIDSQVTSYLDRNGIWSGKKVIFDSAGFAWLASSTSLSKKPGWTAINEGTRKMPDTMTQGVPGTIVSNTQTLVSSCNKSGLFFWVYDIGSPNAAYIDVSNSNNRNAYYYVSAGSGDNYANISFFDGFKVFEVQGATSTEKYCNNCAVNNLWLNSSTLVEMSVVTPPKRTTAFFFVKNGSKLSVTHIIESTCQSSITANWQGKSPSTYGTVGLFLDCGDAWIY